MSCRTSHFKFDLYDLFIMLGWSGNIANILMNGVTTFAIIMLVVMTALAFCIKLWLDITKDK